MRRVADSDGLAALSKDAGIEAITPEVAYFASGEEEVVAAVAEAGSKGLAVTPRGGGTGIPTQSVGRGALVLQTAASASLVEGTVACDPAIVKAELNRYLVTHGLWIPVDPSSYASCTIGGMVANNSSGARTLKYGSTVDFVEGLRVVIQGSGAVPLKPLALEEAMAADPRTRKAAQLLAENQKMIAEEKPGVTKNSSGLRLERAFHDGVVDLPKLFAGSEGTLGVTTQAVLRTMERPAWRLLFIVETSLGSIDRTAKAFRALGPTTLELVDKSVFRRVGKWGRVAGYSRSEEQYMLFCEFDGGEGGQEGALEAVASSPAAGLEPVVISDPAEVQGAWEVRNETLTLAQDVREGPKTLVPGVEDLVVPPDRLGDLVKLLVGEFEDRGLGYIMYGHAGDANLHARPLVDVGGRGGGETLRELMEVCFEATWKMGGSMTGEHGDGRLRAKYVERQYPKTYWLMRDIKALYDPKGMMNPGVKFV